MKMTNKQFQVYARRVEQEVPKLYNRVSKIRKELQALGFDESFYKASDLLLAILNAQEAVQAKAYEMHTQEK